MIKASNALLIILHLISIFPILSHLSTNKFLIILYLFSYSILSISEENVLPFIKGYFLYLYLALYYRICQLLSHKCLSGANIYLM